MFSIRLFSVLAAVAAIWVLEGKVDAGGHAASNASTTDSFSPSGTDGPRYTHEAPPKRHPYYFVPKKVEVYPWYGGVPTFRWGYFGASRHHELVAPHVPYNSDYHEKMHRYGD